HCRRTRRPALCIQCLSTACLFFFFNDTAHTEIYTLSLHDALPICFFVPEHGTMFTLALVRFPPTATKEIQYLNAKGALTYTKKQIGRAVQQECRDRSRMPSSA